ncbi:hypothetical protein ACVWY3_000329 [Bradyrhizobium sp. USDA 4486]
MRVSGSPILAKALPSVRRRGARWARGRKTELLGLGDLRSNCALALSNATRVSACFLMSATGHKRLSKRERPRIRSTDDSRHHTGISVVRPRATKGYRAIASQLSKARSATAILIQTAANRRMVSARPLKLLSGIVPSSQDRRAPCQAASDDASEGSGAARSGVLRGLRPRLPFVRARSSARRRTSGPRRQSIFRCLRSSSSSGLASIQRPGELNAERTRGTSPSRCFPW